ncbi:MAG: SDR family oxidoreductase, partial [Polyangiales bacterium]
MRNKTVIITGASEGIGRELATRAAALGARLVLAARNEERLAEAVADCEAFGAPALAVRTDVANEEDCRSLIDQAVSRFGNLDVLINNAGISMSTRFDGVDDLSIFERLMRVNYLGTVHCTYHALPHLKRSRGLIVGISSLQGKLGFPLSTGYAASKHAMQGFLDSLRIELRPEVEVLVVSPGPVDTRIHERKLVGSGEVEVSEQNFGSKSMPVERAATKIMQAVVHRRRELVMTWGGRAAVWLRPFAPSFVDRQVENAVTRFYS